MGLAKNLLSSKIPSIPPWLGRGAALCTQEVVCHWRVISSGEVCNAWNDHQHDSWLTQPQPAVFPSRYSFLTHLHVVLDVVLQTRLRSLARSSVSSGDSSGVGRWVSSAFSNSQICCWPSMLLQRWRAFPLWVPPSASNFSFPDCVVEAYVVNDRWAFCSD